MLDLARKEKVRRLLEERKKEIREYNDIVYWAENNYYAEATIDNGEPHLICLAPHQKIVLRYAFRRINGHFKYSSILWSQPKKSGKTCIGGLVGRWACETWGKNGDIYFVGNDADQARTKGYAALRNSIELHPEFNRHRGILSGEWITLETAAKCLKTGSKVHAVATDYKGEAGSNPILSVWTELWGFIDKAALRFWAEMAPSPTRPDSLRFVETYAGFVGESELLETLYNSVVKNGRQLRNQDLMDALGDEFEYAFEESPNPDSPIPLYENETTFAYWDSGEVARRMPWQRGDHGRNYYLGEANTQTESQFRRLHENEWVSAESEFIPIELWDSCVNPLPLQPGEQTPLVVGLDAAVTGDCFGLVVVSRDPDNNENVAVRASRKWEPPPHGKIDFDEPGKVLRWLKENFNILQCPYDPHQLEYFVKKYREELSIWFESFEQGDRRLKSDKLLYDLIIHKRIRHDGNIDLRTHIQNCNAKIPKDQDDKLRLIKKSDMRKIDLAVALSMAAAEVVRLNI